MCKEKQITLSDILHSPNNSEKQIFSANPKRFWEIEKFLICLVVGICLTPSEQRRLLKKAGISHKKKSLFEIHEILVGCSDKEDRLSRKVESLLHRKYVKSFLALQNLNETAFMEHWRTSFNAGNYQDVLWVASTRKDLSFKAQREIFGIIHMGMHASVEQMTSLNSRLHALKERIQATEQLNHEVKHDRRVLRKENERLSRIYEALRMTLATTEKENARLQDELKELRKLSTVEKLEQENQVLKLKLDKEREQSDTAERKMNLLMDLNEKLSIAFNAQKEVNSQLKNEAQEILSKLFEMKKCDANCPAFDLCKKRILIVGGIARMESLYRQLIEGSGGVFEYHNGYVKGGVKNLENSFKRADLVLCPVNCNSHAACSIIKNLGKKHKKPVHMLPNFSLSSVSQVIQENINDPAVRN